VAATAARRVVATGLAILVGSVLGASGAILVLGERVRSRAELVANAAPPAAAPATVAAERRELRNEVSFRATVDPGARAPLRLPATVAGVVTRVNLRAGGRLAAGSVPIEVQGRPVIVVPGAFRFYRDLVPGATGPDVAQLQHALGALGLAAGHDGVFGARTQAALARLYRRAGYPPPRSPTAQEPEAATADRPSQAASPVRSGREADPNTRPASTPARPAVVARASELWALSRLPRPVGDVTTGVDTVIGPDDAVLATAAAALRLRGSVPAEAADQAAAGARVKVWDEHTRRSLRGSVVESSDQAAEDGDGQGVPVVVRLDDWRARLSAGRSHKVTILGSRTDGPVLAVPVAAVNQRGDGSRFVGVLAGPGRSGPVRDVEVEVGIQARGWVEVRPAEGRLREESQVVVGLQNAADRTAP
jgi:peptidoglycan hydrolase-like protein with peptidoglycan-binding domain